jgi:small conductance mechanosensitive channel
MHLLLLADVAAIANRVLANLKSNVDIYILHNGPKLVGYLGKWGARIGERILNQLLVKSRLDETLTKFLCRISFALVMAAVCLAALDRLGVNTTSVTAVMAAAGLAVGMALQGSLSNFAAGVLIILFRPLKVGDFVEAGGTKGIVEEINVFSTMLRTPDNIEIIVPNSSITAGNITNYSSKPTRRIDLIICCGYRDDLLSVKRFLEQAVASDPRVLRNPAPVVAVNDLGDNSVNFVVRPWVANADYWTVRWDLVEKIKLGFDAHGFTIPFPQRELHIQGPSPVPAPATLPVPPVASRTPPTAERDAAEHGEQPLAGGLLRPRRAA